MGFPRNAARRGLLASGNPSGATLASTPAETEAVIDWLIAHGEDHDYDAPLPGDSADAGAAAGAATKHDDSSVAGAATKHSDVGGAATKRADDEEKEKDGAAAAHDISAEMDDGTTGVAQRDDVREIDDAVNARFDCVTGWHDGARMYIFYDSSQAYPEYLVQYHD